jgi:hypothetical protein
MSKSAIVDMACELEMNDKSQYQPTKAKRVAFAVSFEGIATKETRDARSGAPSRCDDSFFRLLSSLSNFYNDFVSYNSRKVPGTVSLNDGVDAMLSVMHIGVGD